MASLWTWAAFIIILVLVVLLVQYPANAIGTKRRPDLKGPRGLPIIGNLIGNLLASDYILDNILEDWRKYGPGLSITIPFFGRIIACNTPEMVEHILKTNFDNYVKGEKLHTINYDALGDGIFNADGPSWRFQRKVASHIFTASAFKGLITDVIEEKTELLLKIIGKHADSGDAFDISDIFFRLTLDVFAKIAVSQEFNCLPLHGYQEQPAVAISIETAANAADRRTRNPFWKITERVTSTGRIMRQAVHDIDSWAYSNIEERRHAIETGETSGIHRDLLTLFMEYKDENEQILSDKELRDVIFNFILAGRDTTAQTLSWLMHHTLKYPETVAPLIEEAGRMERPTYFNQHDFNYAHALLNESLRFEPVLPKNMKWAVDDDILPGGVKVYKGDAVMWSVYAMGRLKEIWGPDADSFKPERWLDQKGVLKRVSQFRNPVFNAGPRVCLGQQFATFELIVFMNAIYTNFVFERAIDIQKASDVHYRQSLTHPMKTGLFVRASRRT